MRGDQKRRRRRKGQCPSTKACSGSKRILNRIVTLPGPRGVYWGRPGTVAQPYCWIMPFWKFRERKDSLNVIEKSPCFDCFRGTEYDNQRRRDRSCPCKLPEKDDDRSMLKPIRQLAPQPGGKGQIPFSSCFASLSPSSWDIVPLWAINREKRNLGHPFNWKVEKRAVSQKHVLLHLRILSHQR